MDGSPLKRKVLAYVTREGASGPELLVFRHVHFPEAGVQVPGGTIEPGEEPESAALREVHEESGLRLPRVPRLLNRQVLEPEFGVPTRELFVFQFDAPQGLDEGWLHIVSAGEEDTGLHFQFEWMAVSPAVELLSGGQGRWLHLLR